MKLKGETNTVIDLETKSLMKPSSGVYMDSFLEVLAPERPVRKLRNIKSFPCKPAWESANRRSRCQKQLKVHGTVHFGAAASGGEIANILIALCQYKHT